MISDLHAQSRDPGYWTSGRMCGNSNTSRIDGALVNSIAKRSMPMPSPAVAGLLFLHLYAEPLRLVLRKYKPRFHWTTTLTIPKQPGHFTARRSQFHLMQWSNRRGSGPVTISNQTVSRAPPLPGVARNVLVIHERIFLTQISSFVAGGNSRATGTHHDIHLSPSGGRGGCQE
jgi:hypothetical protein